MTAFDQMRRNRDVLFFILNAAGWSVWGFAQHLSFFLYVMDNPYGITNIVTACAGFVLTSLLRYVCRWLWRQRPLIMVSGALSAAYVATLPMRAAINWAQQDIIAPDIVFDHWYDYFFMRVLATMPILLSWMGLYFGFHFYEANQRERETALRATALAQSAQLKMLRYQLNPHFLFNTLNAISTLVLDQRNSVANTVVTRLADFLRYTLDQDPMKTVTLTQEMTALNLYLEIEIMRFGTRLQVDIDTDPAAGTVAVPSLLLQPLIENAIKYAVSPREEGGKIRIAARLLGNDVVITIDDDGPGVVDTARIDSGRGVGLRNTRERLNVMYGNRAKVELSHAAPGLRITLQFPQYP